MLPDRSSVSTSVRTTKCERDGCCHVRQRQPGLPGDLEQAFHAIKDFFFLFSEGVYEKAGSVGTGTCDASVSLSETNRPRDDIQPDLAVGCCSNTL